MIVVKADVKKYIRQLDILTMFWETDVISPSSKLQRKEIVDCILSVENRNIISNTTVEARGYQTNLMKMAFSFVNNKYKDTLARVIINHSIDSNLISVCFYYIMI